MTTKSILFILIISFLLVGVFCSQKQTSDLVLRSGKVATVDEKFSIHEAVAVKGGKIVFVGSDQQIEKYIGNNTKIIDLHGKLVLPGLIDSHAHLLSLGDELSFLNISGTESYQEIVQRVAEKVKTVKPGEWIVGGRWDQNDWEVKEFPSHEPLSKVSPNNPVYLRRVDGNSAFVNQNALEIAGITKDTPKPVGGVIHKNSIGALSGVLINRAMNMVNKYIPADSEEQSKNKVLNAIENCLAVGLTGVHEAGVGPKQIKLFKDLIDNDQLKLRIYAMLGEQERPILDGDLVKYFEENKIDNYGNHLLAVKSIKLFFDGALGSRGAAFFEPYADDPNNNGLFRITPEYITKVSEAALEAGMGVNTHCIGDRGNRVCLDSYEKALKKYPNADHRFRIEHSQIVRPEDVKKFVDLDVIPAMQPTHCTSDMRFVPIRVGEQRAEGAYAWRWFLDEGLKIPCGSDFPVESTNPMYGIYSAITRQDHNGWPEGGWHPEQLMTREEVIKGFTIWAAHGAFQEDVLGSIEVGKYADFTILDKDILEVEPKEILTTKTIYTIVAGKIVYKGID